MNNSARLIQPNAVNVATTYAAGPLAQPASVAMQSPAGMQVLVLGGLSKVESLAGHILAGMTPAADVDSASAVVNAVTLAERLLAECDRRRTEAN